MHKLVALIGLGTFIFAGSVYSAGDPERGRELASECAACHGHDGNSPSPAFPILAGQHEQYLYSSLKAYQARGRDNAIMSATIVGKSDQQLRDLAAWFASRKGLGGGVRRWPALRPLQPPVVRCWPRVVPM